ncbi:MAG: D-glycero-beta-D-manno-heptose 1-phosphate adenylyltransferase [Gemmatimonadetes bacterium]|nr:MAG: D-glycero-beta-D-manno-heptose 1-phosphate adenylyltransferase [Gemmatimonadota bacterium]
MTTAGKIRTLEDAARWRVAQQGLGPVVFTNGVFDLLHAGHVALLEAARAEGVALVVGVNSDASVRRLGKGTDRPYVPAAERARLLAGLACVDCVVIFAEDTPLALIGRLRPDVLVKGADYAREQIVGADEVEGWGGRVVRIPLVPGKSTTDLLRKLNGPK